jgi:hypothetical protein
MTCWVYSCVLCREVAARLLDMLASPNGWRALDFDLVSHLVVHCLVELS